MRTGFVPELWEFYRDSYADYKEPMRKEMRKLDEHVASIETENAKLREQIHWLKQGDILHVLTDQELADQQKHEREMQASIDALDKDNAKLRELVADLIKWCEGPCCGCIDYESCDGTPIYEFWSVTKDRASELGVEVTE